MSSSFWKEGGKLYLAEALFNKHKHQIRCPNCPGNRFKQGFIKDEGGKSPLEGQPRRLWSCQRSNGRGMTQRCPRVSCTNYIDLAIQQLDAQSFQAVVAHVCRQHAPSDPEHAHLQAYQTTSQSSILPQLSRPATAGSKEEYSSSLVTIDTDATLKRKRHADEDWHTPQAKKQPFQIFQDENALPTDIQTRVPEISHLRTPLQAIPNPAFRAEWTLQATSELLTTLVKMSTSWEEQLTLLRTFLEGTPSLAPTPATLSSPSTLPSISHTPLILPVEPPLSSSPIRPASSIDSTQERPAGLPQEDTVRTIPSTYPSDDDWSSSIPPVRDPKITTETQITTEPSSSLTDPESTVYGMRAAKHLSQIGLRLPRGSPLPSLSPTTQELVQNLVQQFRSTMDPERRRFIRSVAKQKKIEALFQSSLRQCARPELQCSDAK